MLQIAKFPPKRTTLVTLLGAVALVAGNFHVFAIDLVPECGDLVLQIAVAPVLVVKHETEIVELLLEPMETGHVGVVLGAEVVILQQLLVLQMTVLRLDVHKLVLHRQEVLVTLLDLKDLRL